MGTATRPRYRAGIWLALACLLAAGAPLHAQHADTNSVRRLPPVDTGTSTETAADSAHDQPDSASESEVVEPPLPDDWYDPAFWLLPRIWERSFQLGISGSAGNAETLSFQFGTDWKREIDWSKLDIGLLYNKAHNNGVETKNNALLNVDHHWLFSDSPWSLFAKSAVEYDEFKAFDVRLVLNGGASYQFIKSDVLELSGRLGAGASTEFGGPDNRWAPEAVLGSDYVHQWTDSQKFSLRWDYFPEWGDPKDFRMLTKASWQLMLDKPNNLSFKISIVDRYDSTPHGRKPNDVDYAFVLMWKR